MKSLIKIFALLCIWGSITIYAGGKSPASAGLDPERARQEMRHEAFNGLQKTLNQLAGQAETARLSTELRITRLETSKLLNKADFTKMVFENCAHPNIVLRCSYGLNYFVTSIEEQNKEGEYKSDKNLDIYLRAHAVANYNNNTVDILERNLKLKLFILLIRGGFITDYNEAKEMHKRASELACKTDDKNQYKKTLLNTIGELEELIYPGNALPAKKD